MGCIQQSLQGSFMFMGEAGGCMDSHLSVKAWAISQLSVRGCLHVKTRSGASLLPV